MLNIVLSGYLETWSNMFLPNEMDINEMDIGLALTSTARTEILLFIFCALQNGRGRKHTVLKVYIVSGKKMFPSINKTFLISNHYKL